jgi:hypothetical protein
VAIKGQVLELSVENTDVAGANSAAIFLPSSKDSAKRPDEATAPNRQKKHPDADVPDDSFSQLATLKGTLLPLQQFVIGLLGRFGRSSMWYLWWHHDG